MLCGSVGAQSLMQYSVLDIRQFLPNAFMLIKVIQELLLECKKQGLQVLILALLAEKTIVPGMPDIIQYRFPDFRNPGSCHG